MKDQKRPVSRMLGMLALCALLTGCQPKTYEGMTPEQMQTELSSLRQKNQELENKLSQAGACAANGPSVELKPVTFQDLNQVPTQPFIQDLAMLGVFGNTGAEFKPYEPVTRGEFITWLYNAYNSLMPADKQLRIDPGLQPVFKDIDSKHPAYPYVQALSNAGFSVGYEDKTFKPDQPLTREELVAIKVGIDLAGKAPNDDEYLFGGQPYSDVRQIDRRYHAYFNSAPNFNGPLGDNIQRAFGKIKTFKPKQPVLRHEAAATLWQFDQFYTAEKLLGNKSVALKPENH